METVSIDITRAKAIDGWMTELELVWLAERAVEHRCIVEIGSYLGRSTRAMLDHTQGIVYAIDDWKGPRDVYLSKEQRTELYEQFKRNCDYHKNLVVYKIDHSQAVIVGVIPDMVFIDGSHEYEDVKRDIETWLPKISKGGLLCGHDADREDVQQAVLELLGEVDVADNTTIWYKVMNGNI